MLLSMTGYGMATKQYGNRSLMVELRSLNSKYTDVKIKIPISYREREPQLRKLLIEKLERGKIDAAITLGDQTGDEEFSLNVPLFRKYYTELSRLADELSLPKGDLIQTILRIPSVTATNREEFDEKEWDVVLSAVHEAIRQYDVFRLEEGASLETELRLRIHNILNFLAEVPPYETERTEKLRTRLTTSREEYIAKENIDENRFEQEVLFYLEKMDITEEKVRLEQHCKYFLEQLADERTDKGRQLGFISQEIGREINTLGAKAYSSDIQRIVVNMKDDLEKIKELVANAV